MSRNNGPKWISHDVWMCPYHIPATKIPSSVKECWYCGTAQPIPINETQLPLPPKVPKIHRDSHAPEAHQEVPGVPDVRQNVRKKTTLRPKSPEKCAWSSCQNKAASNSKYCSRNCSNKNARARAAQRKEHVSESAE